MLDQNTVYIQSLIDRRSVATYTVLLLATFGLFWIYWMYLIASDLNKLNGIEWQRKNWSLLLSNPVGYGFLLFHVATGWYSLTGTDKSKTFATLILLGPASAVKMQVELNKVWSGNQTYFWPPEFGDAP